GQFGVGCRVELVLTSCFRTKVIDGVVATPKDRVVLGEAVVVKLKARISNALAVLPTNALELLCAERFGDERVVIHRHHVLASLANEGRKDVGRERDFGGRHGAVGRVDTNAAVDVFEPFDLGVLKNLYAK